MGFMRLKMNNDKSPNTQITTVQTQSNDVHTGCISEKN